MFRHMCSDKFLNNGFAVRGCCDGFVVCSALLLLSLFVAMESVKVTGEIVMVSALSDLEETILF